MLEEKLTAHEDLAKRSVNSVKWNFISNIFQIILGFLQSVLLARLLPIETFGVYAGAAAITTLLGGISNFGFGGAFIYRCKETEDLEQTAAVHFTIQTLASLIWTLLMLIGGLIFIKSNDGYLLAFIVMTLSLAAANFAITPKLILNRSVQFKRIAIINITTVATSFIISLILALLQQPLWALLAPRIVGFLIDYILLYFVNPIWKPKFNWNISVVKYFLGFGSKQVISRLLSDALNHLDDVWTKTFLGSLAMGYYSKAFSFAIYPGQVIADPIRNVSTNTYAEIANNREKLSDAFHKTNAFLIRSGFFFVGVLVVTAPEFIRLVLGERWLPMLMTFRLMLPFTLFFPMKLTMGNLFVAVGKPEILLRIRFAQFLIMIAGLFSLGNIWGIEGVALAVDLMMLAGIAATLFKAKKFVDFSLKRFFLIPGLGVILGLAACSLFELVSGDLINDLFSGIIKGAIFIFIYIIILFIFDRKEIFAVSIIVKKFLFNKKLTSN